MDRDKQKEIASKGGQAAHAKGTAHEFDSGEAREAGRKGGVAVSRNREHMAAIGRRGGEARGHSRGRGVAPGEHRGDAKQLEGSFQNSRGTTAELERQVAIDNQNEGVNANTQGNRGGNASLGGERRPKQRLDSNRETLGEPLARAFAKSLTNRSVAAGQTGRTRTRIRAIPRSLSLRS